MSNSVSLPALDYKYFMIQGRRSVSPPHNETRAIPAAPNTQRGPATDRRFLCRPPSIIAGQPVCRAASASHMSAVGPHKLAVQRVFRTKLVNRGLFLGPGGTRSGPAGGQCDTYLVSVGRMRAAVPATPSMAPHRVGKTVGPLHPAPLYPPRGTSLCHSFRGTCSELFTLYIHL